MNRPPLRPLPPRGSTDRGAQQFYRVLTDEERVAAERERLRALGWRPPQPAVSRPIGGSFRKESVFGDELDAYADLIEQGLGVRRALDDEARRRAGVRFGEPAYIQPHTPTTASIKPDSTSGWTGGGRFAVPVPGNPTPTGLETWLPLQQVSLTDQIDAGSALLSDDPKHPQLAFAPAIALWDLLVMLGLAGGYAAQEASEQNKARDGSPFDFDLGSWPRDMLPPEPPAPPRDFDPEEAARIQREFGGPQVNIPPIIDNSPEALPIQMEIIPNVLTGPDILNPPRFPIWMEDRKGNEPTRSLNNEVRAIGEGVAAFIKSPAEHSGGAQHYLGHEVKEKYLKNALTGLPAGGNYVDISFMHPETLRALLIQTIDVRADRQTETSREHGNNVRVIRNMGAGDILVLIPKLEPGIGAES